MIEITNKEQCCGCTACYSICPQKSIDMVPDFEGFLYPSVNLETCKDCKLCEKVCPILNQGEHTDFRIFGFVVRNKDAKVLENSTSGGFFTPLADYVISSGGIVYGAGYDKDFNVAHISVDNTASESLRSFRGSKYVQSRLDNTFKQIKMQLMKGRLVCFSGSPCQVAGLKSYLGKSYDNLITVDFICKGIPSPKLWRKYLDYQKGRYRSLITAVVFRKKTYGYHSSTMELQFSNGKVYHGSGRVDYMLKSFYSELCSRPSCYKCAFKKLEHSSDFTIFDCWHAENIIQDLKDDDRGYTNLLINSKLGVKFFAEIKDKFDYYEVNPEEAVRLDGIMVRNSAVAHPKREEFYKELDDDHLAQHMKRFIPVTLFDYGVEKVKGIFHRTGLLKVLKALKNS